MVEVFYRDVITNQLHSRFHDPGTSFYVEGGRLIVEHEDERMAIYNIGEWHSAEYIQDDE